MRSSSDQGESPAESEGPRRARPTRREALAATGAAVLGGAIGYVAARGARARDAGVAGQGGGDGSEPTIAVVDRRDGITWPQSPPRHTLVAVVELGGVGAARVLEAARAVRAAVAPPPEDAAPLTVLVGLGVPIAHELFPERCARVAGLPEFSGDAAGIRRGGELMLMISAETVAAVRDACADALGALGAHRVLWSQTGFRDAPSPAGTTRSGIGFVDGIVNPRTAEALQAGVWTGGGRRDTFLVVRRMPIDRAFSELPVEAQEQAIGRHKRDGAPLSGGSTMDDIDLLAKHPDGRTKTPRDAHARRAHPANIGRPLMLRRSYSFDDGAESGMLFVAAVADPETFVLTQRRLDEADELLRHASTTAGDCFFIPEELSAPTAG